MKNYIVRIYRHQKDNPGMLVGIAEDIEAEEKRVFSTLGELWAILNRGRGEKRVKKRGENTKKEVHDEAK